jgi:hypothetical protein
MGTVEQYYTRPAFRSGVGASVGESTAEFSYDRVSFGADFCRQAHPHLISLIQGLRDGLDFPAFRLAHGAFAAHADALLQSLDRYGFLRESALPDQGDMISGPALWRDVRAFAEWVKSREAPPLYAALCSGGVGRPGLIAYAVQYYHFVSAGPQIIAAAIPHAQDSASRGILERFLSAEMGHDRLLLASLRAAGVDEGRVAAAVPLPESFALTSGFQVLADQEPLSFYASLFLVEEENPEFHEALVGCCRRASLPEGFWRPILDHAHINEGGDHGAISAELLASVDGISSEARTVVLKQVATAVENLVALEHAILRCDASGSDSL